MLEQKSQKARARVIIFMYILGLIHWVLFMRWGNPSYETFDWVCIHQWLDVFRQAFLQHKIPYHASYYLEEYVTGTYLWGNRFFATPYLIASPQVLLLSLMEVKSFMLVQLLFIYSIGFLGICLWIKKLDLSPSASCFLLAAGCFNGSIVSRIGVGLVQLTGYMLLPLYFWFLYQFIEHAHADRRIKTIVAIQYALFLFFVLLQGSNHNFMQMVVVGLIVMLFYPPTWLYYVGSLILTAVLCSYLIWPNFFYGTYFRQTDRDLFCGYGIQSGASGIHLVNATGLFAKACAAPVNIVHHIWQSLTFPYTAAFDATWAFNLYIGYLGVLIVVLGCVAAFLKFRSSIWIKIKKEYLFVFPAFVVAILAIHCIARYLFSFFQKIIPLPAIDRLPSRLMLYPFTLILIFTSLGWDDLFKKFSVNIRSLIKGIVLFVFIIFLLVHSYGWSVHQTEMNYIRPAPTGPFSTLWPVKTVIYDRAGDLTYKYTVILSYSVTLLAVIFCALWFLRMKREIKKENKN